MGVKCPNTFGRVSRTLVVMYGLNVFRHDSTSAPPQTAFACTLSSTSDLLSLCAASSTLYALHAASKTPRAFSLELRLLTEIVSSRRGTGRSQQLSHE